MASKQSVNKDIKVTVLAPFQVAHGGIVYMPNDVVEVPLTLADEWKRSGWAS